MAKVADSAIDKILFAIILIILFFAAKLRFFPIVMKLKNITFAK
jgi:hypothetical protein